MIYFLVGENVFRSEQETARVLDGRQAEKFDASSLEPVDLIDIVAGQSLFASIRQIIIDQASSNKPLWEALGDQLASVDDETLIILRDSKPDKRTKTYKALQKVATIIACDLWTDRQTGPAEQWLASHAGSHGLTLTKRQLADMVARAIRPSEHGSQAVIDQLQLHTAVMQLSGGESEVSDAQIEAVLPPRTHDNVFGLLEAALGGDQPRLLEMLERLRHSQQPHMVLGLLSSQAINLTALVLADGRSTDQVASDIGAHPFALRQLSSVARRLTPDEVRLVTGALARADLNLKQGRGEPWQLIELALLEVLAGIKKTPR